MREIGYGVINSIAVKGEDQVTELGAGLIGQDTLLHGVPECTPGITAYPDLTDKPKINSIELVGDKSLLELGIEPKRGPEDNYISTAEKAALHTHANKGILDYITGPLVAAWNSAVSWVNEVGAAHVINYLNPHKTSFANIEGYPATPSGKYLKDDGTFAAIPSGGGGSGTPLYLSNVASDIPGYKKLSYMPDTVEVIKTITANNSTVYGETYIFDLPIDLSTINAGQWVFDYWRSVSSAAQASYARIESFLRHSDGAETTTYYVESPSIEDTTLTQRIITYTLQQFTMLPTDRFGIRMSFRTTRQADTIYSYVVGGLRGHSITPPIPIRHDATRDKNGNPDFQHLTNAEKNLGGLATGVAALPTVKEVASKAQFAPNENGTILYHTAKWFTPTGTISTNGTIATSTNAQFTSAMVGVKLIIMGEERIIATYINSTTVTVVSSYAQNYAGIISANWGVFNKAVEVVGGRTNMYSPSGKTTMLVGINFDINGMLFNTSGRWTIDDDGVSMHSANKIVWSASAGAGGVKDIGLKRSSAGVLEVFDGITPGVYRDLNVRNINYYGALTNASDEHLKENTREVTKGLQKALKLAKCVRHFTFKNQDAYAKGQRTGFIAQLLRTNGFEGHVSERAPRNEAEGVDFGWTYKDEAFDDINPETGQVETYTRRVVDKGGLPILQIDTNFTPYLFKAIEEINTRLEKLEALLPKAL